MLGLTCRALTLKALSPAAYEISEEREQLQNGVP